MTALTRVSCANPLPPLTVNAYLGRGTHRPAVALLVDMNAQRSQTLAQRSRIIAVESSREVAFALLGGQGRKD
jgi:hypothetical protein